MKLIMIVAVLLLFNGCAQTGSKLTENATATTQSTDATATEQAMLEQARALKKN